MVGSNFLERLIHACLVSPYLLAFILDSSTIRNQTVSSCASTSSLQTVKLSNLSAETSFSSVSSASSAGSFLALGSRT